MSPRTLKLVLAYDGTAYAGWQRQPRADTVQARVEAALATVAGAAVAVHAAGRTDAGVHAQGQVASCRLGGTIPTAALGRALNAHLPADIRVGSVEEVDAEFHARFSARSKHYRYELDRAEVADPLRARYTWHVPGPLDVEAMSVAAARLVGRHDFGAFESYASQAPDHSTVRTLTRVSVAPPAPDRLRFDVEGDGFLRHMVRVIVGTLVEVGRGQRSGDELVAVLASGQRDRAGRTAPAHGLTLVHVTYGTP